MKITWARIIILITSYQILVEIVKALLSGNI